MRFLCLHGAGTNSQVLETQTAALRYELDDHHTYEFVEGTLPASIAPEIKTYYPESDQYFIYFNWTSPESIRSALSQLGRYLAVEGPFDGILAYSHGASLAATFLLQLAIRKPTFPLPVKCAIFISGGVPGDPMALDKDEIKLMDPKNQEMRLRLPTANIWGRNDEFWPGTSEVLSSLCEAADNAVFLHDGGHNVPNAGAKDAVLGAVKAIRRTVDKALLAQ